MKRYRLIVESPSIEHEYLIGMSPEDLLRDDEVFHVLHEALNKLRLEAEDRA
jgi:hypothetical protein